MGEVMRAAVLEAPRRLGVVERPKPVAGRGAALVRVAATAICHTDLEIYTGRHPGVRLPVVMGHEATGVVEAVGGDTFPLYYKELTVYGSRALTPGDVEPAIELVASGAVDVEGFVTASYPLRRVAAAFEDYERAPDAILRLVIVPD